MSASYNSVPPGEPAFLANRKALGRSSSSRRSLQRSLGDCCYSLSNLIIIFACITGLWFTVKFIYDDPLYECGEHLLTLRFYRQLIYIIVVFPLIILLPLFNAISACFSSNSSSRSQSSSKRRSSLGQPTLIAKLGYQILLILLAFIALVFVAPSIKYSSLVTQIDYEFKRHMKLMYEKDFSYQFLDAIQREYECCDKNWYEANYNYKLPSSCYLNGIPYLSPFEKTCSEAIGWLVSVRCSIIAACLVAIIVAIAILIALDVLDLIQTKESDEYDFGSTASRPRAQLINSTNADEHLTTSTNDDISNIPSTSSPIVKWDEHTSPNDRSRYEQDNDDDDDDDGGFQNRLRSGERRRERPLLASGGSPLAEPEPEPEEPVNVYKDTRVTSPPPAILTKVNYISRPPGTRPKSPIFVEAAPSRGNRNTPSPAPPPQPPPKGVLKKTSSFSRSLDRESLERGSSEIDVSNALADQSEFEAYQRHLERTLRESQRPAFNVRFAE